MTVSKTDDLACSRNTDNLDKRQVEKTGEIKNVLLFH